jgi:hypothetical protein
MWLPPLSESSRASETYSIRAELRFALERGTKWRRLSNAPLEMMQR